MRLSRNYIIDCMYEDFKGKVPKEDILRSLSDLGIISLVTKEWLFEHYITKNLSAKSCAEIVKCKTGTIQSYLKKYGIVKKKFGITSGNNKALRRKSWTKKIAKSQPHQKAVKIIKVGETEPIRIVNSIAAAAKYLGIRREYVRDCLKSSSARKTTAGYRFEFLTEVPRMSSSPSVNEIKEVLQLEKKRKEEEQQIIY